MSMLALLRHAEAERLSKGPYERDAERPLTVRGRERMQRAARGMARMGLAFDRILSSPYVRALQTAEIVAAGLGDPRGVAVEEALASGARWEDVRRALVSSAMRPSVLLVGHEPDLSGILSELLGSSRGVLGFGKGSLAVVRTETIPPAVPGLLESFMRLDQLEALAP